MSPTSGPTSSNVHQMPSSAAAGAEFATAAASMDQEPVAPAEASHAAAGDVRQLRERLKLCLEHQLVKGETWYVRERHVLLGLRHRKRGGMTCPF